MNVKVFNLMKRANENMNPVSVNSNWIKVYLTKSRDGITMNVSAIVKN